MFVAEIDHLTTSNETGRTFALLRRRYDKWFQTWIAEVPTSLCPLFAASTGSNPLRVMIKETHDIFCEYDWQMREEPYYDSDLMAWHPWKAVFVRIVRANRRRSKRSR